jgi:hypothetical protein
MVDALEAVRRALRPNGLVFDLQPEATYLPTVAVRDSRGRRSIGVIDREPDEDVIAAREARERVVREGRFVQVASLHRTYTARFTSLSDFDADRRSHTPTWRLARGARPRLLEAWRTRHDRAVIETTRRMTIAVLRKQVDSPTPRDRSPAATRHERGQRVAAS